MKRILVAGIGNIFFGDDGFGVEVAQALARRELPPAVRVIDFGIRSYDLAYALTDNYDAVILVDALSRGGEPGTLYLIEPDLAQLGALGDVVVDAHSMDPVRVLQLAESLGGIRAPPYLVGCEPAGLICVAGEFGLSEVVQAAVPKAVEMIEGLLSNLLRLENEYETGITPAERS